MKIRKAVFPVAGLGTRFLPVSKTTPKEMLPVMDKPLIQYAVEEAFASGIEGIVFVNAAGKGTLEDHFDAAPELEGILKGKNKKTLLERLLKTIVEPGKIVSVRQGTPQGLGHAIWCARDAVGDEPFAVVLPDDLVRAARPLTAQLAEIWEQYDAPVLAMERIDRRDSGKYGIAEAEFVEENVIRLKSIVEKPAPEDAPSDLAVIGRYILPPEIFKLLGEKKRGVGGEIQLTDAIDELLKTREVYGLLFQGDRFDCGTPAGMQMANLAYAMDVPEIRERIVSFFKSAGICNRLQGGLE